MCQHWPRASVVLLTEWPRLFVPDIRFLRNDSLGGEHYSHSWFSHQMTEMWKYASWAVCCAVSVGQTNISHVTVCLCVGLASDETDRGTLDSHTFLLTVYVTTHTSENKTFADVLLISAQTTSALPSKITWPLENCGYIIHISTPNGQLTSTWTQSAWCSS